MPEQNPRARTRHPRFDAMTFLRPPATWPLALLLLTGAAAAEPLLDINDAPPTGHAGSNVHSIVTIDGVAYFVASDAAHGAELWKSDGTTDGTVLVKDIWPGPVGSSQNLTRVGSRLFFTATDGAHGGELWTSDSTTAGTVMVKDILPGRDGASPRLGVAFQGEYYFSALHPEKGFELWKSDGTADGTVLVKDINPAPYSAGVGSSSPQELTVSGGLLYFSANDGVTGVELWRSDGTEAGTVRVADINAGSGSANPTGLQDLGGKLIFRATHPDTGMEPWVSDGSAEGTVLLADVYAGSGSSWPEHFTVAGGKVFFAATDTISDRELWATDGTLAGTARVRDIHPAGGSLPVFLAAFDDRVLFRADDGSGGRPWISDGTEVGTVPLGGITSPQTFLAIGGTAYFAATTTETGYELWRTDGSAAGTFMVKDIAAGTNGSNPRPLGELGGRLVFSANDGTVGDELWVSDGSEAGTTLLKDIANTGTPRSSAQIEFLTEAAGAAFFSAYHPDYGYELWRSDGTATGTVRVADLAPGPDSARPRSLMNMDGTLLFTATTPDSGHELWRWDGTQDGPALVKDIVAGSGSGIPLNGHVTRSGSRVFFVGLTPETGAELWVTDGTEQNTSLVKDIRPGEIHGSVRELTDVDGTLYFSAYDGVNGNELWKSDGSAAGTVMVKDIYAGSAHSSPIRLAKVGTKLFFTADTANEGRELWKSDGTAGGTVMVKDIASGTVDSNAEHITDVGGVAFFSAYDDVAGRELWKSDGTETGTVRVADLYPGVGSSDPLSLAAMNGVLYFTAVDGVSGRSLWRSDGTPEGTVRVADTCPGTCNDAAAALTVLEDLGYVLFSAYDDEAGYELWVSDGSTAGTRRVYDANRGRGAGSPGTPLRAGDHIFFTAYDPTHDFELHALALALVPPDTEPETFTFTDVTDVTPGSIVTSAPVTITGIEAPVAISVTGGTYSIGCTTTYTADGGTVVAGQDVCVRHTAAPGFATATDAVLFVGGVSDTFTSTTVAEDATPDAFAFAPVSGVLRGSVQVSDEVVIAGINSESIVSVGGGEYSVNGQPFTSAPGTARDGDRIVLRHTAAAEYATVVETVLTVGGVSGSFVSTTEAAPPPSGGGGGALGLLEILLGLGLGMVAVRKRR